MAARKICFLVGSIAMSGGTYVILQHASFLSRLGHDVTLAVLEPFDRETLRWHDEATRLRCVPFSEARASGYDVVVGTWWRTALELGTFRGEHHAYFVQSIESKFYPPAQVALRALVDETYRLPVRFVTEATWIKEHLRAFYGVDAALVRNGIRKDIYVATGPARAARPMHGQPRVLVEGHFNVPFKNTALAVKLARRAGATDIWVLTGSRVGRLPGVSRVFSKVPVTETAEVYRSCDFLVKLSTVEGMFGPPLEMFHCGGTSVVFDVTGHDEFVRANENGIVVPDHDVEKVVAAIRSLLVDRTRLEALKAGALATATAWPSWDESSAAFARWVDSLATSPPSSIEAIDDIVKEAWVRYAQDEKVRLRRHPAERVRGKLAHWLARAPAPLRSRLEYVRSVGEILSPSMRVS